MTQEFQEWLRNNTTLMERTILNYTRTMERFFSEHNELTVENINKFITSHTRNTRTYYIKYAFRFYLIFSGKPEMYRDIVKVKERPKKKAGIYLSKEELIDIVNNIDSIRYRFVALIQYLTGTRAGDLLRFTSDNMMEKDNNIILRLYEAKGGKEQMLFIPPRFADHVKQFIINTGSKRPFLEGQSENLRKLVDNNYRYYYEALKVSANKLGFKGFTSHDFRRNLANNAFDETKDIRIVQKILGHSNFTTTLRYIKNSIDESKLQKIIEELRG
jgi:integrase